LFFKQMSEEADDNPQGEISDWAEVGAALPSFFFGLLVPPLFNAFTQTQELSISGRLWRFRRLHSLWRAWRLPTQWHRLWLGNAIDLLCGPELVANRAGHIRGDSQPRK
jgi:hypothetical protein